MSDKNKGSAREYIESYINEQTENDYLLKEQPRYDPTKPMPEAPSMKEKEQEQPKEQPTPAQFNRHAATVNPISTGSSEDQLPSTALLTSREQRNEIHDAALTVCADLHENLMTCFQHGSWWDKAKMCEEQKQKFWKCFNAQKQFFKDVGYKAPMNTEKEDAKILVGAYKLREKLDEKTRS
ncbi:hypothetical protein G6F37_002351 [Rhizopus arrhizus]|nr:hypothetical protein G6F38_006311 [Rhizopus arrhizus]KAG1162232.1 hypothetical protein G6F37_002351 [Rhizopus arrhizus]